jgi:hypothetical protein
MSNEVFKSEFIRCECYGEGMGIDFEPEDDLYYFSYWASGLSNGSLSIRDRIRYCWQVLTKGKAFNDELILNRKSVDELVNFLAETRKGYPTGDVDFGTSME